MDITVIDVCDVATTGYCKLTINEHSCTLSPRGHATGTLPLHHTIITPLQPSGCKTTARNGLVWWRGRDICSVFRGENGPFYVMIGKWSFSSHTLQYYIQPHCGPSWQSPRYTYRFIWSHKNTKPPRKKCLHSFFNSFVTNFSWWYFKRPCASFSLLV